MSFKTSSSRVCRSTLRRLYPSNSFSILALAAAGIGIHHAGLTIDDRRATEDLFSKKIIRVIVSTSVSSSPGENDTIVYDRHCRRWQWVLIYVSYPPLLNTAPKLTFVVHPSRSYGGDQGCQDVAE